jgi:hypothetical protein
MMKKKDTWLSWLWLLHSATLVIQDLFTHLPHQTILILKEKENPKLSAYYSSGGDDNKRTGHKKQWIRSAGRLCS